MGGGVGTDEVDLELKDLQQTTIQGQIPVLQLLTFGKANNQEAVTSTTTVINLKVTSKDVHEAVVGVLQEVEQGTEKIPVDTMAAEPLELS